MSYIIRPAELDDAHPVAELMYVASMGNVGVADYDMFMTGTYDEKIETLKRLYTSSTMSLWHHSLYFVADVEGEVAATACGGDERLMTSIAFGKAFAEILSHTEEELQELYDRLAPYERACPAYTEGAWVIEHVAAFPRFRGQGMASALIERVRERGQELGYTIGQGHMLIGNAPAELVYRKFGKIVAEKRDPEFEKFMGSPGCVLWERRL